MICIECGAELHDMALRCWKCGTQTPNHIEELNALSEQEKEERLRPDQLWGSPEAIPRSWQKLIRVYRKTWFGRRLAGWVDENGSTFKSKWPFRRTWQPHWSVTEQGHIFIEAGNTRAFVGWMEEDGTVYSQYGRPSSGFFSYPEATWLVQPRIEFTPTLIFRVSADGTVYHSDGQDSKIIGYVEGTSNLHEIAGLAFELLI